MRKILVVDTSVLLYDMSAIHSFPGNDVVLPLPVLDELDRFKDRPGLLGESARYVNRYLDNLRKYGRLDQAVQLPNSDQTIRVETKFSEPENVPVGLDIELSDNLIITTALKIQNNFPEALVKVITKDINLRVKCDAIGLNSEDYYKDHIDITDEVGYTGMSTVTVDANTIDTFFHEGEVRLPDHDFLENQYVIGQGHDTGSFLARYAKGNLRKITPFSGCSTIGFEPKNKEQKFAIDLLVDSRVEMVTLTGLAGSGKTFLALMCGLALTLEDKFDRIIITRSIQPVGRDMGYLPGDINEKMAPWMSPIIDNLRQAFNDLSYFDVMRQKGKLEIAPLAYMRGRTFNNSYVIVDEAQNTTIHELKTIITRIGKGSKIILLGDTDQVDTPYIDKRSNGLSIVVQKFKESQLSGHVHLPTGYRSDIAAAACLIL